MNDRDVISNVPLPAFLRPVPEVIVHNKPWEGGWAWAVTIGADYRVPPVAAGWCETQEEAAKEAYRSAAGWRAVVAG